MRRYSNSGHTFFVCILTMGSYLAQNVEHFSSKVYALYCFEDLSRSNVMNGAKYIGCENSEINVLKLISFSEFKIFIYKIFYIDCL